MSTDLDPEEIKGLIPKNISTQKELNEAEQSNIIEAKKWLLKKKPKVPLTEAFIRELHKRMFKDVWKWAGTYRLTERNIGIDPLQVPTQMVELCKDTHFWIKNKTFKWDELGARFHHRLVYIHGFPNGNGRHAREMTDALLIANGQEPFSWGDIGQVGDHRAEYIKALKEADQNKFERLIKFVRS